jgi:hypothetical protein
MDDKEKFMQKTIVVWLGAFFCCLLWGSAFPCIKIGYRLFDIPANALRHRFCLLVSGLLLQV